MILIPPWSELVDRSTRDEQSNSCDEYAHAIQPEFQPECGQWPGQAADILFFNEQYLIIRISHVGRQSAVGFAFHNFTIPCPTSFPGFRSPGRRSAAMTYPLLIIPVAKVAKTSTAKTAPPFQQTPPCPASNLISKPPLFTCSAKPPGSARGLRSDCRAIGSGRTHAVIPL